MKTKWLSLALVFLSGHCWAQAGELLNAELTINTSVRNPAKAMTTAEGQWLAFSIPAQAGTRSPCCWKGKWSDRAEAGCSLESSHQSYGTRSDSPMAQNVIVFSKIRKGEVSNLRVFGEFCPVEANGAKVTWIGDVDEVAGLDWLEKLALSYSNNPVGDSAMYTLALHQSPDAGQRLYSLAKANKNDLSEEAIFWLGNTRGEQGFRLLKKLLADLPRGKNRRAINFGLAQNNTTDAAALLFKISKSDSDPEQRGGAMFWLAEEYPQWAQDWLLEVIKTEQDEDVLEQAVFAISQLPDGTGDKVLLKLAKNSETQKTVRRQAIFWLVQSDNESSVAALTELLTQ